MVGVLSDWIKTRRLDLGLSQAAAARACRTPTRVEGVHRQTWRAWERGEATPEEFNFVGIEAALKWKPGSVKAILGGGKPTPLAEAKPLLRDDVERELWAIEELTEGMRWDRILGYRRRKGRPPNSGDDDLEGRSSGT